METLVCKFSIEKHTSVLLHHIMCLRIYKVWFCSIAHLSIPSTPKLLLTVQTFRFIIEFYSPYTIPGRTTLSLFFFNLESFYLGIALIFSFA